MSTLRGDTPCHECGTPENIVWFTDNVLWNNAIRGDDHGDTYGYATERWGVDPVLCLPCFIAICEGRGYRPTGWRVTPEWPIRRLDEAATVTGPAWVCPECGAAVGLATAGCEEPLADWEAELLHGEDCEAASWSAPKPPPRLVDAEMLRRAATALRDEWSDGHNPRGTAWHRERDFHLAVADWLDLEADMPKGRSRADARIVARTYLGEQP